MLSQQMVNELNQLFADELRINKNCQKEKMIKRWETPFEEICVGAYLVKVLSTPKQIKSEGYLMRNCVKDYIQDCEKGNYLLFSIKSECGDRIATLGVKRDYSYWVFDECLGENNTPVLMEEHGCWDENGEYNYLVDYTDLFSVAHEVVRLLNSDFSF